MDKEKMEKYTENRFGYLREKTIEELKKLKNELLDDNEYMERHTTNSMQETEFHEDTKFNNEQIDFIDKIINEKNSKGGR